MTIHIKRVVAAMTAVLMLLTLVPTAALPTIQLPALSEQSIETTVPTDDAANEVPSEIPEASSGTPEAPANTPSTPANDAVEVPSVTPEVPSESPEAPANTPSTPANDAVDAPSATPEVPAETVDNAQPVLRPNVVTGPVTPEDVLTSDAGAVIDQDNTLYIDSDNDGEIEAVKGDVIEDDEDFDTEDLFQEMIDSVTVGKEPENTVNTEEDSVASPEYLADVPKSASGVDLSTGYQNNAYEPTETENENHPFIPNGTAWIDLSKIKYGAPASPTYPFTKWSANTSFLNTSVTEYDAQGRPKTATSYVFPDKNLINETIWSGSANYESRATSSLSGKTGYAYNRYDDMQGKWGITLDKNVSYMEFSVGSANDKINLSDTPYLTFSTEHEDGVKLAIAVEIGTPKTWDKSGTATAWDYRWYTITDNNERPELEISTNGRSMEPELQITAKGDSDPSSIINDQAYVDGAITGCIDMVQWLPFVNPTTLGDASDLFHARKVRIYKIGDKPARVNYLYFLNQAAPILSPQTLLTADIDLSASATILANSSTSIDKNRDTSTSSDDKNGWRNGAAFRTYGVTKNGYGGDVTTTTAENFNYVSAANGKKYVTVVIPVRKWIEVAVAARRLAFTTAGSAIPEANRPVFVLYGNNKGYNDPDPDGTGVSESDSLLGVFGGNPSDSVKLPYLVHGSHFNCPGRVDADFSYNLDYKTNSNWFDLLDSPYMREHMEPSGDKAGWVYVSELRIVVPAASGVDFNLGQFSLGYCSDSLNSAKIKGAFDGGTGVQPNIDVSSGQTVTNKAASFGPMLETSNFGTFDLLERPSQGSAECQQNFYGQVYQANADIPTLHAPNGSATGGTIAFAKYFIVYATTTYNDATYLLVGDGSAASVWIKKEGTNVTQKTSNGLVYSVGPWTSSSKIATVLDNFANDNWLLSPFGSAWQASTLTQVYEGVRYTSLDGTYAGATEYTKNYHNSENAVKGSYISWIHKSTATDTNTAIGIDGHLGLARTFSKPLTLEKQSTKSGYSGNAPVLRYNIEISDIGMSDTDKNNAQVKFILVVEAADGTRKYCFVSPDGSNVKLSTDTSTNIGFTENKLYSGYASFDTVLKEYNNEPVKLVSLLCYANKGAFITIRNMEVLYERGDSQYHWYDKLNLSGSTVIDNVDIISDAFNYKIASGQDDFSNRFGTYGEKGWTISTYDLDTSTTTSDLYVSNYVHADEESKKNTYPTYRPSLDHLRIPVYSGKSAKFVFKADRSFPTKNFKYLYISYSVADDDGVAAADDKNTGILFGLHDQQAQNKGYYMAVSNGNATKMTYASSGLDGKDAYSSCVNAAIDLSKLTDISSINEIVFYMKNTTPTTTDFYINYLFLSNVPPTDEYQTLAERTVYHNYYLMDGSGDRYSCRFPTTSNPTGRITSSTAGTKNSRVNPLIIERGDIFYEGTYYNGVPLGKVNKADSTDSTANDTPVSLSEQNALKAVWFYDYDKSTPGETWAIGDFYEVDGNKINFTSTMTGTNVNVSYDAVWNYNRWREGWGQERYLGYNKGSAVEGTLLQLYATGNNVLLRSGLQPKKYQTVYNTHGGQMVYPGSTNINNNTNDLGLIENENNYYITQTVVLSYYTWPTEMGDDTAVVTPTRYGYTFNGWYTAETGGKQIKRYNVMERAEDATLHAQWSEDPDYDDVVNTVSFTTIDGETEWFPRVANRDNEFEITIPTVTQITDTSGRKVTLVGWTIGNDTTKVYTPGMKLTVTKSVTLKPYTDTSKDVSVTIVVGDGVELYADNGTSTPLKIENGYKGISITGSTYSNIPRFMLLVAKPTSAVKSDKKSWQLSASSGTAYSASRKTTSFVTEVCTDYQQYKFAANTDITLNYAPKVSGITYTNNALIWTAPQAYVTGVAGDRQMMFYSQYQLPSTATVVSRGTLYTKDSQVGNLSGWGTSVSAKSTALANAMKFAGDKVANGTTTSAVRSVKASTVNDSNQYYLMVTENKGNAVTYYARGYVEYKIGSTTYVAYSDIISTSSVPAV